MTRGRAELTVVPARISKTQVRREAERAPENLGQLVLTAAERHRDRVAL